jgi:hypothetical protein
MNMKGERKKQGLFDYLHAFLVDQKSQEGQAASAN